MKTSKPNNQLRSFTLRKRNMADPVLLNAPAVIGVQMRTPAVDTITPSTDQHQQHEISAKERKERQMRRWTADFDDLRSKLERDKAEALNHQKEAMNRVFRVQLAKLLKEKEDLVRKCQQQQQQLDHQQPNSSGTLSSNPSLVELQKLVHENSILRIDKKRVEDQLQVMKESEQHRFENMRSLLDDKARELTLLQKQLRQQIARLREESRAKDRVISHLESELKMQTGRAQQFRDILEQNLISGRCLNGQQQNEREDLMTVRERQLQIQVEDLRDKLRHQQETFADDKRQLLRRLSETEKQQTPLRQKNKQYLTRNIQLSSKNHQLTETVKIMEHQTSDNESTAIKETSSNLKRSLTRPNVNQLGAMTRLSKNDKQRRIEYVQQIQKLRKEQRYYSMWDLPPLLEVEADGASTDQCDSSVSPSVSSSPDPSWNEETRRELEILFSQLSREHSELQRNYQMLHDKLRQLTCFSDADAVNVNYATLQTDYAAARARIRDLEEILELKKSRDRAAEAERHGPAVVVPSLLDIQAKFVREKHNMQTQLGILQHRLEEANIRCRSVQAELNESRDQNELLEFRILELEEYQELVSSPCSNNSEQRDRKVDVCTDTDSDDLSVGDSGITSLTSLIVDCPSPNSPSSSGGSSPDSDYLGEKISSVKAELQLMVSSLSDPSQKSVLAQLQALLGVCQSRLVHGIRSMNSGNINVNVNSSNNNKSGTTTNWEWQLQESGIFEEDSQHQSAVTVDGSTQTESDQQLPRSASPSQAIQAVAEMCDFAIQVDQSSPQDRLETRDEGVQACESVSVATVSNIDCQTEESVMSVKDFREIESYYEQQVEILQKEKAAHRKKFQMSRDETAQLTAQLEQLGRQFQERERQFEEILQKNCRAFERELESARNINATELNMLNECLQLVWLEVKDYSAHNNIPEMPKTSVMEFTQALISTLHGICSELGQLRTRVEDLAEMEQAFQMTLQQADGLVHHIEEKHLQRIRELEQTEQDLRSQLMMGKPDEAEQTRPTTDFDGSLEIKIQELERENKTLTSEMGKNHELELYCQQLQSRLEEYEHREKDFHHAVQEAERRFNVREQRYREELDLIRSEVDKCREGEINWRRRLEQREGQLIALKGELEAEQKTITCLEVEVKDLQSKLAKDDTSFRNEMTKLRAQLNTSLAQLNELESLNCLLREQIVEHQNQISLLQRNLDKESSQIADLTAENQRLMQAQMELMMISGRAGVRVGNSIAIGKPLTEELFEVESNGTSITAITNTVVTASGTSIADHSSTSAPATLDDFQEISLPNTPTVMDGCSDVFEEHFKVLESLENYLESQNMMEAAEENDESGISTSPSIHENEPVALLEAQLAQLRTEKHFLLNSVVNSQKKDEIIRVLVDQLKYNAPRQYLIETAACIRKIEESENDVGYVNHDKDIERVCRQLEAPIDLTVTAEESCSMMQPHQNPEPTSINSNYNNQHEFNISPASHRRIVRQRTVTVLPEEDPLLSPASDLRVTRKVGQDGLVIAWLPSPDSECAGYLICVNGHEAQRVRNARRTKAVLCGLNLYCEMEICIYALSKDGLVSTPDTALYRPDDYLVSNDLANDSSTDHHQHCGGESTNASPREVVVQTFYTNSSVTIRSSRRVAPPSPNTGIGSSRIPVRSCVP